MDLDDELSLDELLAELRPDRVRGLGCELVALCSHMLAVRDSAVK